MASGIVRRAMVYLGLTDDDYEDYDAYDPEPVAAPPARRTYAEPEPTTSGYPGPSGYGSPSLSGQGQGGVSAVRPIREPSMDPSNGVTINPRPSVVRAIVPKESVRVHVVAPTRFGDAQEIGDHFKENQPVIVNLQSGDRELSRRMIDFCSGVTYALGGAMDKVADQVFLLTPLNVEVSADEKRKLQERGLYRS
jgi:FtsZ-interacting cell division protein YlmF